MSNSPSISLDSSKDIAGKTMLCTKTFTVMKRGSIRSGKIGNLQLSQLGSRFSMAFSNLEVIGNKMMGLDEIKKKLLVLEGTNRDSRSLIIDLAKVKAISVKKIYRAIQAGALKKGRIEDFLEAVHLQFEFSNREGNIVLPFNKSKSDIIGDFPRLETRILNWQSMLSKISGLANKHSLSAYRTLPCRE